MYGSFDKERLPEELKDVAGKEVARHTLLTRERNLKATRSVHSLSPVDAYGVLARAGRGLPQGSPASPLVAQLMVARVLRAVQVQRGVAVLVYADNVIVLGRRRADVETTYDDLCSAFASSAAGRLDLRLEGMHRARDGFEFLGYAIRRAAGSTRIEVPDAKKEAIRVKLLAALARVKGGVARKDELLKTVRGIRAGLKLADVGLLMMGLLGRFILLLDDPPDELREAFRMADKLCLGRGWPRRACAG